MSVLSANHHLESHLEKWSSFDAMSRSHRADKIKLLREQLEILKLELDCEKKLTNFYREELKDTERELVRVQQELVVVLSSPLPRTRSETRKLKEVAEFISKALPSD